MKIFIILLLFLLLIISYLHPISSITQDLGRHLATGDIILKTHSIPKTNLFSYTYPNFPFINHHWLSEVIYAILLPKIGFNGLLILNTTLILVSFSLLVSFIYKKTSAFVILLCSLLYFPILFERTDVRPEFFSFLFLSIFIVILYKFRHKFTYLIFLLPLIELFWVNMHIYFPIGITVILFFFLDCLFAQKFKINKHILILGTILILATIATLFNPNGIKGALYPLLVFQNYGYSIQENQNIFFLWNYSHNSTIVILILSFIFLLSSLTISLKKTHFIDWLLSIFFAVFAASSIRNFPIFVLATLIPFAKSLSNINFPFPKRLKTIFLVLLFGFFVFEAQQSIIRNGFGLGIDSGAKEGADFFIKQNLKGPILNNFDIGSYLDYRLYPQQKVFVDNRPEAYPAEFFQSEYIPMQEDQKIFSQMEQKYHFQTIFFSHTDQTPWAQSFFKQISENNKWHLAYLDDYSVIWTKNESIKPLIKTNYSNMKSLIQLAYFFQNTGFKNQETQIYRDILNINSTFCPALYNLALRLQEAQDPSFPIFAGKFQKKCQ
jgi:hypothetical protein